MKEFIQGFTAPHGAINPYIPGTLAARMWDAGRLDATGS